MRSFALRNTRIYFRDKTSVLFSLLGVLVVIGLYLLFLAENLAAGFSEFHNGKLLVVSWLVAGVWAITPVTTSLGAMGALVDDRSKNISRDFLASPVKRWKLVGGYLAGGLLAAFLLSMVVMLVGGYTCFQRDMSGFHCPAWFLF